MPHAQTQVREQNTLAASSFLFTVERDLTHNHKLTSITNMSMAMLPKRITTDRLRPAYLSTLSSSMTELTSCARTLPAHPFTIRNHTHDHIT